MALRVLLADESTTIKKVMQLALQDFAVEVKAVHAGVDVVEVARVFQPDIVFADVLLQKKNGYEVCADLKRDAQLSVLPVVLMWSSFMELDERAAQDCAADARLEKPFEVDGLRQLVLELVPRTRSQRLAHFLQFSPNLSEALKKEEANKQTTAPSATAAAPKVAPPPPKPQSAQPVPTPVAAPPPPPTAREQVAPQRPPPAKPQTPAAPPQAAPSTPSQTARTQAPSPPNVPPVPPKTAAPAARPTPTAPMATQKSADPSSKWNMDSFEDIEEFGSDFSFETDEAAAAPNLESVSPDADDADNEDGFAEFKLTNLTRTSKMDLNEMPSAPTPAPPSRGPSPSSQEAPVADDRDPWSHQDLSAFKLDLEPVTVENDDLGVSFQVGEHDLPERDFRPDPRAREMSIEVPDTPSRNLASSAEEEENFDERPLRSSLGHVEVGFEAPDDATFELSDDLLSGPGANLSVEVDGNPSYRARNDHAPKTHDPDSIMPSQTLRLEGVPLSDEIPRLSEDRLEEIIRAQSREIIEAVVRRVVPDLAADIIRRELQRLLEEPKSP